MTTIPADPDSTGRSSGSEPRRLVSALLTPAGNLHRIALPAPGTQALLAALYRVIGCDTVDAVPLTHDLWLYLDDDGLITGQNLNFGIAHLVRHYRSHVHQHYAGSAVLFGGMDDQGFDRPIHPDLLRQVEDVIRAGTGRIVEPGPAGVCVRAQAVVDGDLIMVPRRITTTHGFDSPIAITRDLWEACVAGTAESTHSGDRGNTGDRDGCGTARRDSVEPVTLAVGAEQRQRLSDLLGTANLATRTHFPRGIPHLTADRPVITIPFGMLGSPFAASVGDPAPRADLGSPFVAAGFTTGLGIDPAPAGTLHRAGELPPVR
jgi:hypothetical protein